MRKFDLLLIAFVLLITSCGNGSNPIQDALVSNNEVAAVDTVLLYYGGVCERVKGYNTENGVTKDYFKLKMYQSSTLEFYAELIEMPSSHIAYLFYHNLGEDKEKYDQIIVEPNLESGFVKEYTYSSAQLEQVNGLWPTVLEFEKGFKENDFYLLEEYLKFGVSLDTVVNHLDENAHYQDSLFGSAKRLELVGFSYFTDNVSQEPLVQISTIVIRDSLNTPFSLFINTEDEEIKGYKLSL